MASAKRGIAPAVLLGLNYTSLAVARSLGRRGVPVFGIDKDTHNVGARSRYVTSVANPADDDELLGVLLDFAPRQSMKSVLFPLSDEHLLFLDKNKQELRRHFWFPLPVERSLEQLVAKESMGELFRELGFPAPKSIILEESSFNALGGVGLAFPIVIKPRLHQSWLNDPDVAKSIGARKALLINDPPSLKYYCTLLGKYDSIIAQEFVPGKTDNLYYYVGYRNIKGHTLVSFVGKKLRTFPDLFGSESFLQSVHRPDICRLGEQILNRLNYIGPAGLDFKFDPRDNTYKLIEINCRFGISDGLLATCGVDLPYMYYTDNQGLNTPAALDYRKNVYWCWLEKDIDWFLTYGSRDGFTISRSLLHFLRNEYSYAVYASDDLKPFLAVIAKLLRRLLGKLPTRLR